MAAKNSLKLATRVCCLLQELVWLIDSEQLGSIKAVSLQTQTDHCQLKQYLGLGQDIAIQALLSEALLSRLIMICADMQVRQHLYYAGI